MLSLPLSRLLLAGVAGSLLLAPLTARAGIGDLSEVKMGVHLVPKPAKDLAFAPPPTEFGCDSPSATSGLVTAGDLLAGYYLYVVALDILPGPGLAAMSFGVEYGGPADDGSGIDLFDAHGFADLEFPMTNWPATGTGITVTWNAATNCQRTVDPSDPQGEAAVVAYGFYVYAYSAAAFTVVPRPPDAGQFVVANCSAEESYPYDCGGNAGFGGWFGFSPCFVDCGYPVEDLTWGRLKRAYDH